MAFTQLQTRLLFPIQSLLSTGADLEASLALFDEATMTALRAKSEYLTGYLEYLLDQHQDGRVEIITPRDPARIVTTADQMLQELENLKN